MNVTGTINSNLYFQNNSDTTPASKPNIGIKIASSDQFFIPPAYSLKPMSQAISPTSLIESPHLSPEETRSHHLANANTRDTKAIVSLDGKAVARFQYSGGVTTRNSIGQFPANFNDAINSLKNTYGGRVSVEEFKPGEGPTEAEFFEQFNGSSYYDFVTKEFASMQSNLESSIANHKELQERTERFNNARQASLLSVNGMSVGWSGKNGRIEIDITNLTLQLESTGKDQRIAAEIAFESLGDQPDIDAIESMLGDLFGDNFVIKEFPEGQMPTRAEASKFASEQYVEAYNEYSKGSTHPSDSLETTS